MRRFYTRTRATLVSCVYARAKSGWLDIACTTPRPRQESLHKDCCKARQGETSLGEMRRDTPFPDGLGPDAYRPADAGGLCPVAVNATG